MGAPDLLQHLRATGFSVTVADGGGIRVMPAGALSADLRQAIRDYKPALLALLSPGNQPAVDPDRWRWPASDAMNGAELQTFTGRVLLFTRRSIGEAQAEALADRLLIRDRQHDDRRLCLECTSYRPGRCGNPRAAGLNGHAVGADLATLLQRCPGFAPLLKPGIQPATPRLDRRNLWSSTA